MSLDELRQGFIVPSLDEHLDINIFDGTKPYLLISSHSCEGQCRILDRGCDLYTDLLVEYLAKRLGYYALVNYKYRLFVDMNRPTAHKELFRQFIPYYLTRLRKTYKKIPLLYDIHSFPEKYEWVEKEKHETVVFLFSFSKKMVIDLFLKFWIQRGYATTFVYGGEDCDGRKRACNDITVSHQDVAYPFLFEFREEVIKKREFLEDAVTFFQLLETEIEKRRTIKIED